MEELSTLATGYEVDGGQLRYQLYIWLEKSVSSLKDLCHYCCQSTQDYSDTGMLSFLIGLFVQNVIFYRSFFLCLSLIFFFFFSVGLKILKIGI